MWKASIVLRRGRQRVRAVGLANYKTRQKKLYHGSSRNNKLLPLATKYDDNNNYTNMSAIVAAALLSGGLYTASEQNKVQCGDAVPLHRSNPFSISTSATLSRRRTNSMKSPPTKPKLEKQDSTTTNQKKQHNIPKRYPTRHSPHQPRNVMLHRMRSIRARGMNDKYKVEWGTVLGEGAYGSVHPARLRATGQKVALKKISKRYTNSSSFRSEADALLRIYDNGGHPNISGLRDMYEDATYYYMILDLVSGGEMFEHLIHYGAYSEADAARLMHEVASALAFLHGVGVVHADLKPENLLLCSKKRHDGTIKMIDFGCAVVTEPENFIKDDDDSNDNDDSTNTSNTSKSSLPDVPAKSASSTGTTAYWPPERFKESKTADAAMDMWSVGVILYIMLTGLHPFDVNCNSTDSQIEEHIQANPYPPLSSDFTGHLSASAVDLITKLMEVDPSKRITAYEMLHHPWVLGETATKEKILDSDKKLSQFVDIRNKLEAGIFAVLVSHGHRDVSMSEAKPTTQQHPDKGVGGSEESTQIMKRAFDFFDSEGKGYLTPDDLSVVVRNRTGSDISSTDAQEFIAKERGREAKVAKLSFSDFSGLFSGLKHKHFPRGHIIFRAGDEGDAMYFLNSGKVEIQTRKGQLVSILRSGDFFGEGSLLREDKSRFTTAKCSTPVDVIKIKREDFDKYVASSKETKNELLVKWRARNLSYAKNLIRLQTNVKTRVLKKGDVVYREGDVGTSMFRVCDGDGGELEVSHGGYVVHKYSEGESFGESSLLFARPRSSTVTCISDTCKINEMRGEDFMELVSSSPEMAATLRDMCRKRLFKKAVKAFSLEKKRGYSDEDIVDVFHEADTDKSGYLDFEELKNLMHGMDPSFPIKEIELLLKFIDVDEDGLISLAEFKRLFRQFEADQPH